MPQIARYDLAIIGSGPGGYRAAVLAALNGLKVAIIERQVWGGCCLNRGCVPKKAWYAIARIVAAEERYRAMGLVGRLEADLASAWSHQRRVVDGVRASYLDYLARLGVTTYSGHASFTTPTTIALDGEPRIDAGHVVIATGSTAATPSTLPRIPGLVLTTDDLFEAAPPAGRRVAIIGSGAVATELAFILTMLGCEVDWHGRRAPLDRFDYSVPTRQALARALDQYGIVYRRAEIRALRVSAERHVELERDDGSMSNVDWVLLGTGRAPNTVGLALDRTGVTCDGAGFIAVDERCRTTDPRIFAIGDAVNAHMSANHALADAAVAVANIVTPGSRIRDAASVPDVIYSALEMARIGLSEDGAEARGLEPATGFAAFESNPAALGAVESEGFVRIVADMDTGALLGAEVVGAGAGDTMQVIATAMGSPNALHSLARASYNHPARSEEILNAIESLASRWGLGRFVLDAQPRA